MIISNTSTGNNTWHLNPPPAGSNSFIFKIERDCITSAGIFSNNKRLIKTLWSGKKYTTGTYTAQWDGTDDEGKSVVGGNYEVIVLSNNMQYTWEGVIGNTSERLTGSSVFHHHETIRSMCIVGNTAYYAVGYNEQASSQQKFYTNSPYSRTAVIPNKTGQSSVFVVSDNTIVYWAGHDLDKQWFVFGTNANDDSQVTFPNSSPVKAKFGRTYNAIDILQGDSSAISGLTVQKKGRFLLISHKLLNEIHILDKKTGALVFKQSIIAPTFLAIDSNDSIWICYSNNRIEKYIVNENGSLTPLNIQITGLISVQAIAVSPDNKIILIADAGTSQQLKAYQNTSGKLLWTFGQAGGYKNSSRVTNNKFYFSDTRGNKGTFVCFDNDNSFWVGDSGNYRTQHYDLNRKFINRIMYLPTFYSCSVDPNNPSRVFADYLEFEVDYSKNLAPNNGSWNLVANWGVAISNKQDNKYFRMKNVTTLINGRTYMLLPESASKNWQLAELGSDKLRLTGLLLPFMAQLYLDGSIRKITNPALGKLTTFILQPLIDFDSKGNPRWGSDELLAISPINTSNEPLYKGNPVTLRTGEITDSGVLISFDASHAPKGNNGYHLGGLKLHTNQWLWRTAKSTPQDYTGDFPLDGSFDIGNGVKNAGSTAMVIGNHIIWGYYGEFWKGRETNKWNHVYHNGLFINQFGVTGLIKEESLAMFAGNAFSAALVKAEEGKVYLYHNDENAHGGIHRWLINGFETVQEQVIKLVLSHSEQGLSGNYFKSADLNNFNIISTVTDSTIDFPSLPLGSVRWKGFLKSNYSEDHTFYIITNGQVRFWLDEELIIDQWNNSATNEFSTVFTLNRYKLTPIKLELSSARNISLLWSSSHQQKEIISTTHLMPTINSYSFNKYNLLDGFNKHIDNLFENDLYGWKNITVQNNTSINCGQPLNKQQNVENCHNLKLSEQNLTFQIKSSTTIITRDIRLRHPVNAWALSGVLCLKEFQLPNHRNYYFYFDLLDRKDKMIARLCLSNTEKAIRLCINTSIISVKENMDSLQEINESFPINVKIENKKVQFGIKENVNIIEELWDNTAEWTAPEKVSMYLLTEEKSLVGELSLAYLSLTVG